MCWTAGASAAMVGVGAVATVITWRRGDPAAIPATLAFFTVMELLQAAGYAVVDQCGSPANRTLAFLSYAHIAIQPIFINAFAMAIGPRPVGPGMRRMVYAVAGLSTLMMFAQLLPLPALGACTPGDVMCSIRYCLISGEWHIGWEIPLNGLWNTPSEWFGRTIQFPPYLIAVFILPLVYGAWRLVIFHALFGPILAAILTGNPFEMPAIWCLFSIGLALIALTPMIRSRMMRAA